MSQHSSLITTFQEFADKYKWTKLETATNMYSVMSDLDWGFPVTDVLDGAGNIDFNATGDKEFAYVFKSLWGIDFKPDEGFLDTVGIL